MEDDARPVPLDFTRFAGGQTPEEIWENAASAAVYSMVNLGLNASTVILPSGAGDIVVGLRALLGYRAALALPPGRPFRAVVVVPVSLVAYAHKLYSEQEGFRVVNMAEKEGSTSSVTRILREEGRSLVILSRFSDLQRVCLAQLKAHDEEPVPFQLLLQEAAHIVRAGGYREVGVDEAIILATRRLYISARQLSGRAPGALLGPDQEGFLAKEEPASKFGPEVYRLSHAEAEERSLSVPLRLVSLTSAKVSGVAKELAVLHDELGVQNFQIVGEHAKLTERLDELVRNLTSGACGVSSSLSWEAGDVHALIIAGSAPSYASLAEELPRLARWAPGKRAGYVLATAVTKHHSVAAWRALAIEDLSVEEAIQRGTVEWGHKDRRLSWEQVPHDMRRIIYENTPREQAEVAVARGVEGVGDPWDAWLGRLAAYREKHRTIQPRRLATVFGHELGVWVVEQRARWERGLLDEWKVARLKAMGLMLDLDTETFAQGLAELRKYVVQQRSRVVPLSWVTESRFHLGAWVVEQRTRQRRGRLDPHRQELLREAFFLFQPSEPASFLFEHPANPEAAALTQSIEGELKALRWRPIGERRRAFRQLVLKHHPDLSEDRHANEAIQFLADTKDWFLAGY